MQHLAICFAVDNLPDDVLFPLQSCCRHKRSKEKTGKLRPEICGAKISKNSSWKPLKSELSIYNEVYYMFLCLLCGGVSEK